MDSCLHILADESVKDSYLKHKTFHEGDAGLDLFCPALTKLFVRRIVWLHRSTSKLNVKWLK